MKNLEVEITYKWEDEKGRKIKAKASVGGDWYQWGANEDYLSEIMPLTEKINDVVNEFIVENCEEEDY